MFEANIGSRIARVGASELLPYGVLTALLVAFGLYVMLVSGPAARALAQEQLARTIADENEAVCGRLGMKTGTRQFEDCTQALATVRQNQVDRDQAAEFGL